MTEIYRNDVMEMVKAVDINVEENKKQQVPTKPRKKHKATIEIEPWDESEQKCFEECVTNLHGWGNWALIARSIPNRTKS